MHDYNILPSWSIANCDAVNKSKDCFQLLQITFILVWWHTCRQLRVSCRACLLRWRIPRLLGRIAKEALPRSKTRTRRTPVSPIRWVSSASSFRGRIRRRLLSSEPNQTTQNLLDSLFADVKKSSTSNLASAEVAVPAEKLNPSPRDKHHRSSTSESMVDHHRRRSSISESTLDHRRSSTSESGIGRSDSSHRGV